MTLRCKSKPDAGTSGVAPGLAGGPDGPAQYMPKVCPPSPACWPTGLASTRPQQAKRSRGALRTEGEGPTLREPCRLWRPRTGACTRHGVSKQAKPSDGDLAHPGSSQAPEGNRGSGPQAPGVASSWWRRQRWILSFQIAPSGAGRSAHGLTLTHSLWLAATGFCLRRIICSKTLYEPVCHRSAYGFELRPPAQVGRMS